jgi:hypothetical protein
VREKLNDNPVAQVAILGVLALVVGFLLITRMGGSPEEEAAAPAATTTPTATDTTAVTPTDPSATVTPVTPTAPVTPVTPAPGATTDFKAGPGLPKDVVAAFDSDKVVVLLVVDDGGIDDQKLKGIVEGLGKRSDTALFVVEAGDIADYSRIAQGVDLQQTPALVVLQPKKQVTGPQPMATLAYGFRGPDSVVQLVEDALYKGRSDLPYYPTN